MPNIISSILFQNSSDGTAVMWGMDGAKIAGRSSVIDEKGKLMHIGAPFSIVGTGDFDGSGSILFQNSSDGTAVIWFMDGAQIASRANVIDEKGDLIHIGAPFSIVGTGDFDGSGDADILFRNSSDGTAVIWFMDGAQIASRANVVDEQGNLMHIEPPFSIVGTGDFNGNGKADILFQNSSDGSAVIWFMDGAQIASRANVVDEQGNLMHIEPPFSIVETGDFDGNGAADILFRNSSDGSAVVWFMDGAQIARRASVVDENGTTRMQIGPPFSIVGVITRFAPPVPVSPVPTFQPYRFNIDSVDILTQKADSDHSDSAWLTLFITVADPAVKSDVPVMSNMFHLGGEIRTGDHLTGDFSSDLFTAKDTDLVTVTYLIVNLGSSDAEAQFAQAVKITSKIVDDVGPIVGAAIGLLAGDPAAGISISEQIIDGFDKVIKTAGDAFDFLGIHFAPANCNGEVQHDTVSFQPGELARDANISQTRSQTGPQENNRCGAPPEYRINFSVQHFTHGVLESPGE